jgi:homocysteine S-methyltransferase
MLDAEFMANELPGMRVPPAVLERMRRTSSTEEAAAEGIAIAVEVGRSLKGMIQGVHVAAQPDHLAAALAVVEGIGK